MSDKKDRSLKPGWRQVKFGEVVRQCKQRADPETSGLKRYIAGDHMDTDDLRLRRWGEIGSGYLGPAFHIRFRPGQVLYGSRRTYLRKVAVPDFEGICANTTFVVEPKNTDELLPEFLPFLMQTEAFNGFSVKHSKGSVNPYINFSDLARFEFALPPIEEQRRILALLRAMDALKESHSVAHRQFETVYPAAIEDLIFKAGTPSSTLEEIAIVTDCRHRTPKLVELGIPMIAPGDIKWGKLNLQRCKHVAPEEYDAMRVGSPIGWGDIVLSRNQSVGIASYVAGNDPFVLGQDTVLVQARSVGVEFIYLLLRSRLVQRQIAQLAMGSTFKRINLGDIRRLRVPKASPELQSQARVLLDEAESALEALDDRSKQAAMIRREALNDLLASKVHAHV